MTEKPLVTQFSDLMPPLISRDPAAITFRDQHKDIIIKPLFGNGGAGCFGCSSDQNLILVKFFGQNRGGNGGTIFLR